MKFGFFTIIPFHESDEVPRLFHETLERIELVDQLGFDEVWIGEHHFSRHGLVSGINTWMGAVAARTRHVRIGTAITILPFHNPIIAAEEAATLDILSNGRLNFGIGSGYQRQEFDGLGVPIDEARGALSRIAGGYHPRLDGGAAHLSRQIHPRGRSVGAAQTGAETAPTAVHCRKHQPFQRRVCRQPSDSGHCGWPYRRDGSGTAGGSNCGTTKWRRSATSMPTSTCRSPAGCTWRRRWKRHRATSRGLRTSTVG